MKIEIVEKSVIRSKTKYSDIYEQLPNIPVGKAMKVEFDTASEARLARMSVYPYFRENKINGFKVKVSGNILYVIRDAE